MSTLWSLYHNIFTRAILPIYLFPSSEQSSPTYRPDAKQRLAMRHEIDTFVTVPGVSLPAKIPPALRPTSRVMSSPKGATALPKLQKSRHNVLSMSHDRFSDVLANATTLSPIAESVASDSTIYFPASDLLQEDTDSASHTASTVSTSQELFIRRPVRRNSPAPNSPSVEMSSSDALVGLPRIPPLDLRPPFPGPHPDMRPDANGATLRPHIIQDIYPEEDSDIPFSDITDNRQSLHADSFVGAIQPLPDTLQKHPPRSMHKSSEVAFPRYEGPASDHAESSRSALAPHHRPVSSPSVSESFIDQRWAREELYDAPLPARVLKARQQRPSLTPGFWAFWLGFLFPVLWIIGGWHFTNSGEQPPMFTFWEFFFNGGYWKMVCCCRRPGKVRKFERSARKEKTVDESLKLPRWIVEQQCSEGRLARLRDPKGSLRGISFGYPFVARPIQPSYSGKCSRAVVRMLGAPHRLFDRVYGVHLEEVRGQREIGRRMFDPWIQRCRYAVCYTSLLIWIGLCAGAALVIVFTR